MTYDPHGEFLLAEIWWRKLTTTGTRNGPRVITRPELAALISEARSIPEPQEAK